MICIYNFYIFCDAPLDPISARRKASIARKTHIINNKGSKVKDKFLPSYLPSYIIYIYIYELYIMIQIITIIVLPDPTEHDIIIEYRFFVMSSSGVIISN